MNISLEETNEIKLLYNRYIICQTLFLEDASYEEKAIDSFIAFTMSFDALQEKHGLTDAHLDFNTQELAGYPISGERKWQSRDEIIYYFYMDCLKKNPYAEKYDILLEKMMAYLHSTLQDK